MIGTAFFRVAYPVVSIEDVEYNRIKQIELIISILCISSRRISSQLI